ncbi:MAG: hypothetical protein M1825_005455 [Sarcosagium campestre]|nr:MAG: hypothetical protein M1825_005455 [Sarcosagium campestre]
MPSKLDPAVIKALSLDPASTSVASHGGSGFSTTAKISTTTSDGTSKHFFMKTGQGAESEVMFKEAKQHHPIKTGEHESLNAIHAAVSSLCPASLATGQLSSGGGSYLVTSFLDMRPSRSSSSAPSLAAKLAKLHTTPAPCPLSSSSPQFGFPVTTCCGSSAQPNNFTASWADFFANQRLRFIARLSAERNGSDAQLNEAVERTAMVVVPRLLRDGHLGGSAGIRPVVVHGDLWSGNKGLAAFDDDQGDMGKPQPVVFDPSACYSHSEYDLGIMNMFGGFDGKFWKEYHRLVPKTEPVEEYDDRVKLYELYHHLNHHAIFGGGYRAGAMDIMQKLWRKYGEETM